MNFIFFLVSCLFVVFLFTSYFLKVLRFSLPLFLIYIVFCISYVVNQDLENIDQPNYANDNPKKNILFQTDNSEVIKKGKQKKKLINSNSKTMPIASFDPKPIIIDSNIIFKKDIEKPKKNNKSDNLLTANVKSVDSVKKVNTLDVKEIIICRGVYKRNPIKPGFEFTNNVDSLFCYTKISNSGPKKEIKHLWYFKDKKVTTVVYNIKTAYNYRSWSRKTILPSQTGKWRVEVVDENDVLLASRNFSVSLLNDVY
jgi:hypothetical protein